MSVEENKKSANRCFEELWNKRDLSLIPELISEDYAGHSARGEVRGLDGFEKSVKDALTAIPDINHAVNDILGEGDKLAISLTLTGTQTGKLGDTEPTGEPVNVKMLLINRYLDGKCVESTAYSAPY